MVKVCSIPKIDHNLDQYIYIRESYVDKTTVDSLLDFAKTEIRVNEKYWHSAFVKYPIDESNNVYSLLNPLWEEILSYYKTNIHFIEKYHIKSYSKENFYTKHTDNFITKIDRKLTFIVQLSSSESYQGGNLLIQNKEMPRSVGTVIVFPSFFEHEITPIEKGERLSLITWAWGPLFDLDFKNE